MPFDVYIDDNFHYMDESERVHRGSFETYEEALAAARRIVEESVRENWAAGRSGEEIYRRYQMFGDDPFIIPGRGFSAWSYAREFAERLANERHGG
jgi:hypothetical protein